MIYAKYDFANFGPSNESLKVFSKSADRGYMEEIGVTIKAMPMLDHPGYWCAEIRDHMGNETMIVDAPSSMDAFIMGHEAYLDLLLEKSR